MGRDRNVSLNARRNPEPGLNWSRGLGLLSAIIVAIGLWFGLFFLIGMIF